MIDFLSPGWGFVLYPLFGCCLSVLLTRVCIRVLQRLGYVDKPGGRHTLNRTEIYSVHHKYLHHR